MRLNHPEAIPLLQGHEKMVFHETGPLAKKVGDHCSGPEY